MSSYIVRARVYAERVCVRVCASETRREKEGGGERERERERDEGMTRIGAVCEGMTRIGAVCEGMTRIGAVCTILCVIK
jgi:hypothetical protein